MSLMDSQPEYNRRLEGRPPSRRWFEKGLSHAWTLSGRMGIHGPIRGFG